MAALQHALTDSSEVVREAAQRSLSELLWNRPAAGQEERGRRGEGEKGRKGDERGRIEDSLSPFLPFSPSPFTDGTVVPLARGGRFMSTFFAVLLAQSGRGDSLSESFRTHAGMGHEDVLLGLLMVSALVAGLWATSRLLGLRRRRRGYHNPWQLFWELCKARPPQLVGPIAFGPSGAAPPLARSGAAVSGSPALGRAIAGAGFALEFARLRTLRKQIFDGAARSRELLVPAEHRQRPRLRLAMVGGMRRNDLRLPFKSRPTRRRAAWRRRCCPVSQCRRWTCRRGRKRRRQIRSRRVRGARPRRARAPPRTSNGLAQPPFAQFGDLSNSTTGVARHELQAKGVFAVLARTSPTRKRRPAQGLNSSSALEAGAALALGAFVRPGPARSRRTAPRRRSAPGNWSSGNSAFV